MALFTEGIGLPKTHRFDLIEHPSEIAEHGKIHPEERMFSTWGWVDLADLASIAQYAPGPPNRKMQILIEEFFDVSRRVPSLCFLIMTQADGDVSIRAAQKTGGGFYWKKNEIVALSRLIFDDTGTTRIFVPACWAHAVIEEYERRLKRAAEDGSPVIPRGPYLHCWYKA